MIEAKLAGAPSDLPVPRDFDTLPGASIVRAFGVDYGHVCPPEGGDLYVTRFGWHAMPHVLPAHWYVNEWYARSGARLIGGTGMVYRVRTRPFEGRSADIVVKFSRMAQDVPVEVRSTFPEDIPTEILAAARVNSPLEEFGLRMELRAATPPDSAAHVLTQRPFAIYAAPETFPLWQLGRDEWRFNVHRKVLEDDQRQHAKAIELDIRRIYVLLYGWVEGRDAEEVHDAGEIDEEVMKDLTIRVIGDLGVRGYRVLDNKPKHFILRKRRSGPLVQRHGELAYALVDFEFLQRTPEHQRRFRLARRHRYWEHLRRAHRADLESLPSHLQSTEIFGVPYLFGTSPDGGRAWVVGRSHALFDYFAPERWRRTPRVKLSPTSEVYRTRTKDGIHLVYRRSRLGTRPRCDPLSEAGKRIRAHGYNSPFEEVATALRLQAAGIRTVHPRAIIRTGHHTTKAVHLRDDRRFRAHAGLATPGSQPEELLSPLHDYYTIWGYFRGIDPGEGTPAVGVIDVGEARELGLLDDRELAGVTERIHRRLRSFDFPEEREDTHEFVVALGLDSGLRRDAGGEPVVTTSIDLNTAYEQALLDEAGCRRAIAHFDEILEAAGFERLDKSASDLLLSMHPDGDLVRDREGEVRMTLCNLELVRGLSP